MSSKKKQEYPNQFYLSQFANSYSVSTANTILTTLDGMLKIKDCLYGFGIYFKSNNTEFSIVLKLKKEKGRNWIHIGYLLESTGWKKIIDNAGLGPKELYEFMDGRGNYTFRTKPPKQFSEGQPVSQIVPYFAQSQDVEYKLAEFDKYSHGGNNRLIRQKSRKQNRVISKTSRKNSRKNSRKMI